jgi:hypothetical protein
MDGFDVVAVRIEDEGGVVALAVGAWPGSPVVAAAGGEGGGVERVDGGLVDGVEGDVDAEDRLRAQLDGEVFEGRRASAEGARAVVDELEAERRKGIDVERAAGGEIADRQLDVAERSGHGVSPVSQLGPEREPAAGRRRSAHRRHEADSPTRAFAEYAEPRGRT